MNPSPPQAEKSPLQVRSSKRMPIKLDHRVPVHGPFNIYDETEKPKVKSKQKNAYEGEYETKGKRGSKGSVPRNTTHFSKPSEKPVVKRGISHTRKDIKSNNMPKSKYIGESPANYKDTAIKQIKNCK